MSPSALLERERRGYVEPRRRRRGFLRFLLVLVLLLLCFAAGLYAPAIYAYYSGRSTGSELPQQLQGSPDTVIELPKKADAVSVWNVMEIIKPASDLVTVRYYYTDADIFENSKQLMGKKLPLTTNKTIFTYDGVISLGVDFSGINISVDDDARAIVIEMPEPKIIANEIDAGSFQYYDVTNSVFNTTEMGDVTDVIDELKAHKEAKVLASKDIMAQAADNAQSVILGFLQASELTAGYDVSFR